MRVVIQRVKNASVSVGGDVVGKIDKGLVVLLGVEESDTESDVSYMAEKVVGLRIFHDADGKMNLSTKETGGEILAVSQFTLLGDARKGKRPSFSSAARPEKANELYKQFVELVKKHDINVQEGVFQAEMLVNINNDGPVTILLDSKRIF